MPVRAPHMAVSAQGTMATAASAPKATMGSRLRGLTMSP